VAHELLRGAAVDSPPRVALAARLTAGGLAHPVAVPAPATEVTVVIPVRDRPVELARCLAALGDARVVVVDDGSQDPEAVARACAACGARLVRRPQSGGPGAARNTGLAHVDTELVAFLDSDCVPTPGWLALLCGVLTDPAVGAVAPRIRPLQGAAGAGPVARYAAQRSPLDMGPAPAQVRPGGRVAYLPAAALLVRRAALGDGFTPQLRFGEDVDLVWRLVDAGWTVRYEPVAVVAHAEPRRWRALLRRRSQYGSAAGPLARRHPERLAPAHLHPGPVSVIGLACARRPGLAAAAGAVHVGFAARRLTRAGVPPRRAIDLALGGLADSGVALGRAATMLAPALLAAGLWRRRTRPAATALLLAEPLRSWARARPALDPLRWSALAIADDVAYGAGVWAGALRSRTLRPLTPDVVWRRRASAGRRGGDGSMAAGGRSAPRGSPPGVLEPMPWTKGHGPSSPS
jgi:mycofactocin system glycosyltransferase